MSTSCIASKGSSPNLWQYYEYSQVTDTIFASARVSQETRTAHAHQRGGAAWNGILFLGLRHMSYSNKVPSLLSIFVVEDGRFSSAVRVQSKIVVQRPLMFNVQSTKSPRNGTVLFIMLTNTTLHRTRTGVVVCLRKRAERQTPDKHVVPVELENFVASYYS